MWNNLDFGFQVAFEQAWEAYCGGTTPIGASIIDTENRVVAKGRNQIASEGDGLICHSELAHAEMNALLALSGSGVVERHPRIRECVLYTTLEPCPMCFGAIVMSSIRHVRFAARDSWAGATHLNESDRYIKSKNIWVEGPFCGADAVAVALHMGFAVRHYGASPHLERILAVWEADSPAGKRVGQGLGQSGQLSQWADEGLPADQVYDRIAARCRESQA